MILELRSFYTRNLLIQFNKQHKKGLTIVLKFYVIHAANDDR